MPDSRDAAHRNPDVDAWFASCSNPQKDLVQAVRDVVLGADDLVTETIKWQAPTFRYDGNIASLYPKATKHVSLMFHTGAALPDHALQGLRAWIASRDSGS
ncbi:DUF1801 domain-containing protein [Nocardioides sp. GCM10027113]|uniref:DUF1801 domain-containing protein n=1 Tax=unclassified Nocardioides TaxID=2615069 RepID=UPI00360E76AA